MRLVPIVLAVLALALAGVGCGGGDDESAGDDAGITITDSIEETDETTTDETTDDSGTDTDAIPDFGDEDCQGLVAAYIAFSQALGSGLGGEDLGDQAEAIQEFAEEVPEEIEDDVRTLATAYREYADALANIDLGSGGVPSADQLQQIQEAAAALGPEVTAASERVSAWTQENCQQ
jgi:hypothetical protein